MKARELLTRSLQMNGVLGEGETPSAQTAVDVLALWNGLIELWSISGNNAIFEETRENFALAENTSSYTIGTGGAFNTVRPLRILQAYTRETGITEDRRIEIIGPGRYAEIRDKSFSAAPSALYYDAGFPLGTIILDTKPPAGLTLFLQSEKPLSRIASLDTELSFPPGYEMAYLFNVSELSAPLFEKEASQTIKGKAYQYRQMIEDANALNEDTTMRCDDGLTSIGSSRGDWRAQ